jgi:sigma-B regulation protein RsbU (phosphoserine phosphatase)
MAEPVLAGERQRRALTLVASICVAIIVYGGVRGIEGFVLRYLQPQRGEMRSVSNLLLAGAFGVAIYMWLDLRTTRASLSSVERSRLVVETQLALAAEVQRGLLPPVPISFDHVRWASQLEPAGKIGGDFYDFIPTGPDTMLVLVGDVSGKGIPAALLQASAHSLFRTLARSAPQPAELLELVSREIYAENAGALYLTCLAVSIDGTSGRLLYANAGHPAGVVVGKSGRRLLSQGGPPVGMFAEAKYQSEVLRVEAGDLGVIVTDGITEAIEQAGVPTVDRLDAVLSAISSSVSPSGVPQQVCEAIMALADHSAGPLGVSDWQDDKTVLAFMVEGRSTALS